LQFFNGGPVKTIFARYRLLYGSKFGGFFGTETPHSEFEGTNPAKKHVYQSQYVLPLNVQIGPKLRPVGWPRKRKKIKNVGEEM